IALHIEPRFLSIAVGLSKVSPGGGHILSSSNSIHHSVKPENYLAMVETAKKYGKYLIRIN
ncbi:hypothetical protein HKBW3S47_01553, partial [Candidatus Hakubella thermalkaliphila]